MVVIKVIGDYLLKAIIILITPLLFFACTADSVSKNLNSENYIKLKEVLVFGDVKVKYAYIEYTSDQQIDILIKKYIKCKELNEKDARFLSGLSEIVYIDVYMEFLSNPECNHLSYDGTGFKNFNEASVLAIHENKISNSAMGIDINDVIEFNHKHVNDYLAVPLFVISADNTIFCIEKERNSKFSDVEFLNEEKVTLLNSCLQNLKER